MNLYLKNNVYKNDIVLSFIYVYTFSFIRLKYFPVFQTVVIDLIILFYVIFNKKLLKDILRETFVKNKSLVLLTAILWEIIFFVSFLLPSIYSTCDTSFIISIIGNGFIFNNIKILFALLVTYRITKDKEHLFENFIKYNIYSLLIYISSTFIFTFIPVIKELWRNIIYESALDAKRLEETKYITRFGLDGYSGFLYTFKCSFFSIVNLMIISIKETKNKLCLVNYLILFVLLCGNLFYGRVGVMFTLITIFAYLIYDVFINNRYKLFAILLISFMSVFIIMNIFKNNSSMFRTWYVWAMAPVESFLSSGKIGTSSSDEMFSRMSFWPEWKTFLFGDGRWNENSGRYYCHTDLGYMRFMLYFGVLVLFLCYLLPIMMCYVIFKKNKYLKLMSALIVFQLIFFELKGDAFYLVYSYVIGILLSINCKKEYLCEF